MSTYIPPIDHPDAIYRLYIRRYDPDRDDIPHWDEFRVPWVPAMTVIQALEWLWDQGKYVAFRANCREFTCGSCAMLINGKQQLACDTLLEDNACLEPLRRYPVLKDLVVDTSTIRSKWQDLELWPHAKVRLPLQNVSRKSLEGWHRSYARCIECYACLDACPTSDSDTSAFAGPMWMLQIARAKAHPLDDHDRLGQVVAQGIGHCVSCYECADVCPVNLSPVSEIQTLRREVIVDGVKRWVRRLGLSPTPAVRPLQSSSKDK